MTFDDIWNQLCEKRPALRQTENVGVNLSRDAFKQLLRQVYEAGQGNPITLNGEPLHHEPSMDPLDVFGRLFGGPPITDRKVAQGGVEALRTALNNAPTKKGQP